MIRTVAVVLGTLLLVSPPLAAAFEAPVPRCAPEPRRYLCPRVETAPVIDGVLDDDAWERALESLSRMGQRLRGLRETLVQMEAS